jgi:hypothetical protein
MAMRAAMVVAVSVCVPPTARPAPVELAIMAAAVDAARSASLASSIPSKEVSITFAPRAASRAVALHINASRAAAPVKFAALMKNVVHPI